MEQTAGSQDGSPPPEGVSEARPGNDGLLNSRWSGPAVAGGLLLPLTVWLLTLSSHRRPVTFDWLVFPAITAAMLIYPFVFRQAGRPGVSATPGLRVLMRELVIAIPVAAGCLGLNLLIMLCASWLWPETPYAPQRLQHAAQSELTLQFLLIAAWSVIVAPVAEEFFYRGFLQNAFRRYIPMGVAVAAQAVVFGVSHGYSPGATVSTVLLGVILGLVCCWRRTMIAPCLVHALYNAVGFAVIIGGMLQSGQLATLGIVPARDADRCVVVSVIHHSPAAAAGILANDVIVEIDGQPVSGAAELLSLLRRYQPLDEIWIDLERDGRHIRKQVVLVSRSQLRRINDVAD